MAEDLTTFTEVDEDSDITVTATKCSFDTLRTGAVSYVYKDYTIDYFGDVVIDFEVKIDSGLMTTECVLFGLSNTVGTFKDMSDANDGLIVWARIDFDITLFFRIQDFNTDNVDTYWDLGDSSDLLYCRFERSGEVATCKFYSDSERTTLIDTVTIACETGTKRYLYVLASREGTVLPDRQITGYSQNFTLDPVSSSPIYKVGTAIYADSSKVIGSVVAGLATIGNVSTT
jgi:hypothetical protein